MAGFGFNFDAANFVVPNNKPFVGLPIDMPAMAYLVGRRQWVAWRYKLEGFGKSTKPPVNPHNGYGASHSSPATWGTYEEALRRCEHDGLAGVGFVLADGDDLSGLDLDGCIDAETGVLDPWAQEIVELGETYAEISPSGIGIRFFALGKVERGVKHDPAGVEVYGKQRFLTVTGNHLPWTPTEIRPAPRTIAMLLARVEHFKAAAQAAKQASAHGEHATLNLHFPRPGPRPASGSGDGNGYFRAVNDQAMRSLSSWVPSLFPAARRYGTTGGYRITSKALGRDLQEDLSITPSGIVDFGVHDMGDAQDGKRTPIDLVLEHGGVADAIAAAEWLCGRLGFTPEHFGWGQQDRELAEAGSEIARRLVETATGTIIDAETGEVIEDDPAPANQVEEINTPLDENWLHPPGLVGEIADWIVATSRRPNRPLAIAAAIVTIGTVCGRHLAGPTASGTHLYIACIGDTGVGKDWPLKSVTRLLQASKLANLATTGKFMSVTSIENAVIDSPCLVATIDEMGAFFAKIMNRRASSHEAGMGALLRELWSNNFDNFTTSARAKQKAITIQAPAFSLFGVSTADEFYNSMSGASLENGFINRLLIIRAAKRARRPETVNRDLARNVPQSIVKALQAILPPEASGGNLTGGVMAFSQVSGRDFQVVPWAVQAAEDRFLAFEDEIFDRIDSDAEVRPFLGRTVEMAIRLATIRAVGIAGRRAKVGLDDLEWGIALARSSADVMLKDVLQTMAENDHQANYKLVLNRIRKAPDGKISRNDLFQGLKGKITKRDLDSITTLLVESDEIEIDLIKHEGAGRPRQMYRIKRRQS